MYIAKTLYHRWEEEPISGINHGYKGTFAIFFYGCNMHCVYCQNNKISRVKINANNYNPMKLAKEIIEAEKNGAYTISFITSANQIDEVVETIKISKDLGLKIPVVYNSNGYETSYQIKKLNGLIDIYLPDFKYFDDELGEKYSGVPNYFEIAKECIDEMYNQVSKYNLDIDSKGLIIRHLVLPSHTEDSKNVINYLFDKYGNNVTYSIMAQYTPILGNIEIDAFKELKRKITKREYDKVINFSLSLGITNAYTQDLDTASESFIPEFS